MSSFADLYFTTYLIITLRAGAPDSEDVLPVLGDTEEVDDGVPDHGHHGRPEQQHLVLQLVRPQVRHRHALHTPGSSYHSGDTASLTPCHISPSSVWIRA